MKRTQETGPSARPPTGPPTPARSEPPAPRSHVAAVRRIEPGRPRRAWSLLLRPTFERK